LAGPLFGEKAKPGLVKASKAETRTFSAAHELTGEVQMSEGKTVHVSPPLPGVIRKVHVRLGERVSAGEPLFDLDSHDVAQAKAEYLKALAALSLTRKTAERERTLFEKKISAAAEVQEAEARKAEAEVEAANAKAKLLRLGVSAGAVAALVDHPSSDLSGVLTVRAPRAGTVLETHAVAGEHLEPGKDVVLLSDLSEVWVWANLKEGDLQTVTKAGGRLTAEVEAPGTGKTYRGTVDIVSGVMDEATRTVKARVVLANPGAGLRPGMFVKVRVLLAGARGAVAVPKVAVLADEGRPFVFIHKEGEYWIRRPVVLGERSANEVEIREGLQPGQTIIADGSFLLKSDVLKKKMGAGCAD
ncbi:MAG: efflux RND transporter periplasmic adaptor subunit, partial [Deltaproteobacteria bacterium]|nr:efflux RND transporter periplasmic adaptor subunit [Deltaproteobacteria bacterium]